MLSYLQVWQLVIAGRLSNPCFCLSCVTLIAHARLPSLYYTHTQIKTGCYKDPNKRGIFSLQRCEHTEAERNNHQATL